MKKKKQKKKKEIEILIPLQQKGKTFSEVTQEIFKKTKGGINGETKTLAGFRREIEPYLNPGYLPVNVGLELQINKKYWYAIISHTSWGYDYFIPQTRKEEEQLKQDTGYYEDQENYHDI